MRGRECSVDGCDRKAASLVLCHMHYKRLYAKQHGYTPAERQKMLERVGGKCESCGTAIEDLRSARFDHDHKHCPTLQGCPSCVRGILCNGCNSALGYLHDDPARVRMVLAYIERFTE